MKSLFNFKRICVGGALAITALTTLVPGIATAALEEIVVTAERRAQSQQDVPLAITTISGDAVSASGITEIRDIALKTPNLTVTQFNIAEPQLFLRGIGSTNDSAGSDPTVSLFIDDVYIARSGAGTSDLYDLDRIEILRGPQGTLYGRNVTGGAISMITKKPSQDFEAKVSATVGDYGLSVLRAYANGPLSENLAGKVTLSKRDRDGYAKNIKNGQELDDADNLSGRGQLLWTASDATEVMVGLDFSSDDNNGSCRDQTKFDALDQPAGGALVPLVRAGVIAQGIDDPRTCGQSLEQFAEKDIFGALIKVTHDFGNMQLTSITGYREADYAWLQELTGGDTPPQLLGVADFEGEESDQISQEFRLTGETDKLYWIAGAYYINENVDRFAQTPIQFGPVINPGLLLDQRYTQVADNTSYALFGQLTYSITDSLDLTLGGRQTWDEKNIDQSFSYGTNEIFSLTDLEDDWNAFTPRATLDWKFSDDHMLFMTYSEGYKSGIFISQSTSPVAAASTLAPEDAKNFEIGLKTEWLDNRLRVNATVFDLEVENLQLFRLVNFLLVSDNASMDASGLELDFSAAITDNFTVSGIYSSLDATFNGGEFDGNKGRRAPDNKFSITADYQTTIGNGGRLNIGTSVSYVDDYFNEVTNNDRSIQDSSTTWDASIRYTNQDEKWNVELWGKNLSDELITVHSINGSFGGSVVLYAPPKTVGATFTYFWN
jgi:iron complex outermembrane receptor protein